VFRICSEWSAMYQMASREAFKYIHSGPTPRGNAALEEAIEPAAPPSSSKACNRRPMLVVVW
jgi:hypothetical protein